MSRTATAHVRTALAPVRVRVTLAATAAALLVALIGSFAFVALLRDNLTQSLQASAAAQVETVEAQLRRGATPQEAVASGQRDVFVQVVDTRGVVVATDHDRLTTPVRTTPGRDEGVRVRGLHDSYAVLAQRIRTDDLLVVVGRSEEQLGEATSATSTLLVIAVPVGLAALALVVWLSVGRALRPVESMRREVAAISTERLDLRLQVPPGRDELPRLAQTLNQMLDRIDASHRLQRQFVSDASHELRSPLAALRQSAEVARNYPDRASAGDLAADVLAEERRMEELVTALLTLARLDDVVTRSSGSAVDLDDLVLEEARSQRDDRVTLDLSHVSSGQVSGNEVLLRHVVRNLLSNAQRHARGRVEVSLREADDRVRLEVHDDGAGIPPDQRDAVFERFVRLDEARSRDAGGSGLGLSIVEKVVEGAGGTVSVSDSPLGGACFLVELPALR